LEGLRSGYAMPMPMPVQRRAPSPSPLGARSSELRPRPKAQRPPGAPGAGSRRGPSPGPGRRQPAARQPPVLRGTGCKEAAQPAPRCRPRKFPDRRPRPCPVLPLQNLLQLRAQLTDSRQNTDTWPCWYSVLDVLPTCQLRGNWQLGGGGAPGCVGPVGFGDGLLFFLSCSCFLSSVYTRVPVSS
jgi:hypothetical protein